jgi:hypothetical protein
MVTMWKSRKRWPVLLALLVAFGGLAVAFACLPYGSRVTRENCDRIQEGMTEAEVRAILGKPWDDSLLDPEEPNGYWAGESIVFVRPEGRVEFMYGRYWMGDNIGFFVGFDAPLPAVLRLWVIVAGTRHCCPRCPGKVARDSARTDTCKLSTAWLPRGSHRAEDLERQELATTRRPLRARRARERARRSEKPVPKVPKRKTRFGRTMSTLLLARTLMAEFSRAASPHELRLVQ